MFCTLCGSGHLQQVDHQSVKNRRFLHCLNCDLIFVPENDHESEEKEKNRYKSHQNSILNPEYVQFLMQAVEPVYERFPESQRAQLKVLDYGCGPDFILSQILEQKGFRVTNYDPYFYNNKETLNEKWDLIFSTEVWEHFRNPKIEIEKISALLNTQGIMIVMTQLRKSSFYDWWYPRDFTHIAFYSEKTMQQISKMFTLDCKIIGSSVMMFTNS